MKALGIVGGFDEGADLAAGVPVLRAAGGGKQSDMLLALNSGNFGGPEFFGDALETDAVNLRAAAHETSGPLSYLFPGSVKKMRLPLVL
jgi:hypothetical protein